MVFSVNGPSLLSNYLSSQAQAGTANNGLAGAKTASPLAPGNAAHVGISKSALDRAAGTAKAASAGQALETAQKALGADLRTALAKAGVKLSAPIEFSVKDDGTVDIKGGEADKKAVQAFLKNDTSQPSFASRIANQARDALKLSASIQQSAAISQAAKVAKSAGGVMSLYTSLMQQAAPASVVFSLSATSSSLTYPGSLTANA
jgi:hypothetical protein